MKTVTFQSLRNTIQGARSHRPIPSEIKKNWNQHCKKKSYHTKSSYLLPNEDVEKQNFSMRNKSKNRSETPIFLKKNYIHKDPHHLPAPELKSSKSINITPGQTPIKCCMRKDGCFQEKEKRKTLDVNFQSAIIRNNTENNQSSYLLMTENKPMIRGKKTLEEMGRIGEETFLKEHEGRRTLPNKTSFTTPTFLKKIIEKNKKVHQFKISDFINLKTLGIGKYGTVNLVMEKESGFICAMKILNKVKIQEEDIENTLIQQIKIQFFLDHPNIVKAFGYFSDQENVYLLLEYCPDGNLEKVIKKKQSLEEEQILSIISNIFEATFYLHCQGILHRDIKPENIVISNDVHKICDFGWAAYSSGQNRSTFCGTPLYVSPEVLKGNGYNQKADIWGLGILCYELVYGQVPFKMDNPKDMIKIMRDKIQFPDPQKAISQSLLDLIQKMLNRNYEERSSINQILSEPIISKYIANQKQELSLYFV